MLIYSVYCYCMCVFLYKISSLVSQWFSKKMQYLFFYVILFCKKVVFLYIPLLHMYNVYGVCRRLKNDVCFQANDSMKSNNVAFIGVLAN